MENKLYPNYITELQELKAEESRAPSRARTLTGESEMPKATDFYEVKELMAIAEAFDKSDKKTISPMSSYSTNLRIKELSETAIAKRPGTGALLNIIKKAEATIVEASEKASAEQANSKLFNYYGWISDLQVASDTMTGIAKELDADPNLGEVMRVETKDDGQAKSVLDRIRNHFEDLKKNFENVIKETGDTIGQAGQSLMDKLGEAGNWLKKNIVPRFVEAFKLLSKLFDDFRLKLFESMFDFVRKVVDLAATKNWRIEKIIVGMPEIGISSTTIYNFIIPIPTIKAPPVTFYFKPM
jgi:hypothetical protein